MKDFYIIFNDNTNKKIFDEEYKVKLLAEKLAKDTGEESVVAKIKYVVNSKAEILPNKNPFTEKVEIDGDTWDIKFKETDDYLVYKSTKESQEKWYQEKIAQDKNKIRGAESRSSLCDAIKRTNRSSLCDAIKTRS